MSSPSEIAKVLKSVIGENDQETTVSQWLDTGFPPLNSAGSGSYEGAFPVGRIIEIAGPPSSGKTAIATAAMIAAQNAGGIAGFMDHERSFSMKLAANLGLDITPGRFVFKTPRTFEESITICVKASQIIRQNKLIPDEAPICWVFDSLASMVPKSALLDQKGREKEAEDRNMNDNTALARATSAHLPAFTQHVEELNICAIFLNQVRTKIGVLIGDPRTTPGGDAPKFYASQRLMLSASMIKDVKTKAVVGAEVTGVFIKNKTNRPFLRASWRFIFQEDGTGRFDVERSLIDFLEEQGSLESAGPGFVKWDGVRIGKEALAKKIREEKAINKLKALLPAHYEPPVVATVSMEDEE